MDKIKMQTSKKITWVFIVLYIILIICGLLGLEIYPIFDSVQQIMIIIVVSYFSTKTVENVQKINLNPDFDTINYEENNYEEDDI